MCPDISNLFARLGSSDLCGIEPGKVTVYANVANLLTQLSPVSLTGVCHQSQVLLEVSAC